MKSTLAVALIALYALSCIEGVLGVSEEESKKYFEACLKDGHLSDDDLKIIIEKKIFLKESAMPSKNIQCAILCWYKKAGFVSPDDKPNIDELIKFVNIRIKNEAKVKLALAECRNVKGADMCETIFNLEKCIHDHVD